MKLIPLSQGKFAQVDDADYEWLMQWKWSAYKSGTNWYATRPTGSMHKQIMNPPKGMVVDHIDRDGLNNQRSNLRVCTPSENRRNARKRRDNTSGYLGVTRVGNKWKAQIQVEHRHIELGMFLTPEDAARTYDEVAYEYHGEFAVFNFPSQKRR